MNDPHVEKLYYKVSSSESISYDEPEPISSTNDLGSFRLRDGSLVIEPTDHFADKIQAREKIEPFLQSWEFEAYLKSGLGSIRFDFDRADVVDLNPPPPGAPVQLQAESIQAVPELGKPPIKVLLRNYPEPPIIFRSTPDVEACHLRWSSYKEGREPLPSMAYFVYTMAVYKEGKWQDAARKLHISEPILSKISKLSSTKGGQEDARKVPKDGQFKELSGSEKRWLEEAVRLVILRLGEIASGKQLVQKTMSDLPPL